MDLKVTIGGLPELLRELQRLEAAAQGRVSRNMAMGAARVVARHARALAPVETGALRKSIRAKRGKTRLAKGQAIAFHELDLQRFSQRSAIQSQLGLISVFDDQWNQLSASLQQAQVEAQKMGLGIIDLTNIYTQEATKLQRQQQQIIDQAALAIIDPFQQLIGPLRDLGIELDRSLMNPLGGSRCRRRLMPLFPLKQITASMDAAAQRRLTMQATFDAVTPGSGVTVELVSWFAGYDANNMPESEIPWSLGITHLNHFSAWPTVTGSVSSINMAQFAPALDPAAVLASRSAASSTAKFCLCVGGAASDTAFKNAIDTDRPGFIADIVSKMNTNGYEGVDIDWEHSDYSTNQR